MTKATHRAVSPTFKPPPYTHIHTAHNPHTPPETEEGILALVNSSPSHPPLSPVAVGPWHRVSLSDNIPPWAAQVTLSSLQPSFWLSLHSFFYPTIHSSFTPHIHPSFPTLVPPFHPSPSALPSLESALPPSIHSSIQRWETFLLLTTRERCHREIVDTVGGKMRRNTLRLKQALHY